MERAQYVMYRCHIATSLRYLLTYARPSDLLSAHEITKLLDEDMTAEEMRELEEADRVCRRLLQWDLEVESKEERDPRSGLAKVLQELECVEE